MNCAECRDNFVGYIEGLLSEEESLRCRTHLGLCANCRTEYETFAHLQKKLEARGRAAASVSIADPVMRRILQNHTKTEREPIMTTIFRRWGLGLGAAAGMAVIALIVILTWPQGRANAAETLERGAKAAAGLSSIHMQCSLRTLPDDNFGAIAPDRNFVPIELWKQFGDSPKWRIDKPGRIAFMNGQSTVMYLKYNNAANKLNQPSQDAFDTKWLHEVANVAQLLTSELGGVRMQGNFMRLTQETGANGAAKSVVTIESKSNLPDGDYLKNKFFNDADTRRVYVFDEQSNRLETVRIYLMSQSDAKLIFEVNQIHYNPSIDPDAFNPQLPENVALIQEGAKTLPDNERYATMTPEQTARAFFEACGRNDWDEVAKFSPVPFNDQMKNILGGLQIVSIGESFKSESYPGSFVPYEIKFKNGKTQKHNLALKKDSNNNRWYFDGGL
jgi:outer membrane lipoprotein-sorting protein